MKLLRLFMPKDVMVRWVVLGSSVVSIAAFLYFFHNGGVVDYKDASSHLQIARRVTDNLGGFSLAQLGGVWLPGPHVLMIPLVMNDWLFYSGTGGSIISMISFVFTNVFLYKITSDLMEDTFRVVSRTAGLTTVLVFSSNPNVLYMQSTPMTEMLLFAGLTGLVFATQRWIKTEQTKYIGWAALAAFFATMTRYEAWMLLPVLVVVVIVMVTHFWRYSWRRALDLSIIYVTGISFGVGLWLLWNKMIFKSLFYFQTGKYSVPSLWVGDDEPSVGNIVVAMRTYAIAVASNIQVYLVVLAAIGLILIALLAKKRLSFEMLPMLSMLTFVPSFVLSLYLGQRPLHVPQISGDLYNVRFGLVILLPVACLVGFLAGYVFQLVMVRLDRRVYMPIGLVAATTVLFAGVTTIVSNPAAIVTLQEPVVERTRPYSQDSSAASRFLAAHYDGGRILMESYGNEQILVEARIAYRNNVYEGTNRDLLWENALRHPAEQGIDYIVMRRTDNGVTDTVYKTLAETSALESEYHKVFDNEHYEIWTKKEAQG